MLSAHTSSKLSMSPAILFDFNYGPRKRTSTTDVLLRTFIAVRCKPPTSPLSMLTQFSHPLLVL